MSGSEDFPHKSSHGAKKPTDAIGLEEALGLVSDAIAVFDADGRLALANESFRRFYSKMQDFALMGTSWDIFLLEAERHEVLPRAICDRLRLIEEDLLESPLEPPLVEVRGADGLLHLLKIARTSGEGFALTHTQVVDRQGQAESDRQLEQLMSKVLEACPSPLTMSRIGDGQILYRSPAATELLGNARNSMDHFARREERADFVTALLPDARVDDMRVAGRGAQGEEFPAAISARLIDYLGEDVVVSTMLDLTDEIAMQEELVRQKELNFQSEKMSALGELLAGVAHELNNPLSIVVGNALILKEEVNDEAATRRIEKLSDAAERCVRIVRSFLSMVREQPMELAPAAVSDLVQTTLDAYTAGDPGDEISLQVELPPDLPDLMIDEVQIVQVLLNLMINAEHAMTGAEHGDRIRISARALPGRGLVQIRVTDNGPGVPEKIRGRIFDPLFTTKSAGKGTGVGLAFCHRVVNAHKGSIQLDTRVIDGAAFVVNLPMATPAPALRSV